MNCKNCNKETKIVNKFFGLCDSCNKERLHGSKYGKTYKPLRNKNPKAKKSLFSTLKPKVKASTKRLQKDEAFYYECFKCSNHRCEECGKRLPTEFKDSAGNVNARWRYSHIIPKSIAPELRHVVENINHLCIACHNKWDKGQKELMKIYESNKKRFPKFFK